MTNLTIDKNKFWEDYNNGKDGDDKRQVLKNCIKSTVRDCLRLENTDLILDNTAFADIGVDSLMMIELKNLLQSLLGEKVTLSVNSLRDCTTTALLAKR